MKLTTSAPSAVHGRQYDTKYVTFEQLLHAAFVGDTIWGVCLYQPVAQRETKRAAVLIAFMPQVSTLLRRATYATPHRTTPHRTAQHRTTAQRTLIGRASF